MLVFVVEPDVVEEPLDVVDVVDHGCHTNTAMSIATSTMTTIPIAAAPLPPLPPSFTTTGPSAIQDIAPFRPAPAVRRTPVISSGPVIPTRGLHASLAD